MEFGVVMFPTDLAARPDEVASAAEERGFSSIFFPEHTHIPTSRRTPWPGGAPLPEEYKRTFDPFVALPFAAAVTTRIRVGTGICLVGQRDPIVLAKEVASIDVLSGGRFLFGVGFGWNEEEMEDHGTDPRFRRSVVREKILAMKALWTQDEAAFDGRFVRFSESWSWPKPLQRPHPPIILGGSGSAVTFRHVVEWADAWMPIEGRYDIVERVPDLRRAAEEAGRDPDSIEVGVFGFRGNPETLERYAEAGIARVIFGLPPADRDTVLRVLDRHAGVVAGR